MLAHVVAGARAILVSARTRHVCRVCLLSHATLSKNSGFLDGGHHIPGRKSGLEIEFPANLNHPLSTVPLVRVRMATAGCARHLRKRPHRRTNRPRAIIYAGQPPMI